MGSFLAASLAFVLLLVNSAVVFPDQEQRRFWELRFHYGNPKHLVWFHGSGPKNADKPRLPLLPSAAACTALMPLARVS